MNEKFYRGFLDQMLEDIRQAETEEADLSHRLDDVRQRLTSMRRAVDSVAHLLGKLLDVPAASVLPNDMVGVGAERPPIRHADVAEQILREAGTTMRVSEIANHMTKMNHRLPIDTRLRNSALFSALRRRPNVFSNERGLWGLKEWAGTPPLAHQDGLGFNEG